MFALALMVAVPFTKYSWVAGSLADRVESLKPLIGCHPPNIKSHEELDAVERKYVELLHEMNAMLAERSDNRDVLFLRGYLQSMGFNFDYPGAWEGASEDFRTILQADPAYFPAAIELANLWVHTHIELASKAEKLFRSAQYHYGDEPLEVAQRGIFYALFYQGKIKEALAQSIYLKTVWPMEDKYKWYNEMARASLAGDEDVSEIRQLLSEEWRITNYKKRADIPKAPL